MKAGGRVYTGKGREQEKKGKKKAVIKEIERRERGKGNGREKRVEKVEMGRRQVRGVR